MLGTTEDEIELFHEKIAENVKEIRKRKKLTQLDLALELGFKNPSFISHVENKNIKTLFPLHKRTTNSFKFAY